VTTYLHLLRKHAKRSLMRGVMALS